jgi:hypothetical protein
VDEIIARLSPAELEQVNKIVGRSPNCYPPGVYAALKDRRTLVSPPPQAVSPPLKVAPTELIVPPTVAAQGRARPPQKASALRRHAADGKNGATPHENGQPQ